MTDTLPPLLQTLQQSLNRAQRQSPDNHIRLDSAVLGAGSSGIVRLFQQTLFQDYLALKGQITVTPDPAGDTLVVRGTAAESYYDVDDLEVVCTFGVAGDAALSLCARMTPPAGSGWTFARSFYELEGTFFQGLTFTGPAFLLSTHPREAYRDPDLGVAVLPGASFFFRVADLDGPLAPVQSLIATETLGQPPPPFYGPLVEDASGRSIELRMPFPDVHLAVSGIPAIVMSSPALVLTDAHTVEPEHTVTSISAQGNVPIGGTTLPLAVLPPAGLTGWQIELQPGRTIPLASLADLLGSVTGADLVSALPDPVKAISGFAIDTFFVAFDREAGQFSSFAIGITSGDGPAAASLWKILPGLLEVKGLSFLLVIERVAEQGGNVRTDVLGTIQGRFELIDALEVVATLHLPLGGGAWTLATAPNQKLSLNALARYIGGSDMGALLPGGLAEVGEFTLLQATMTADPSVPTLTGFEFALASTNPWKILPGRLVIENLMIRLRIDDPLTERALTGRVAGTIRIGRADVEVSVSRDAPTVDWMLGVRSRLIPLPSLQDIAGLFGADLTGYVPEGLADATFQLSDLNIALDLTTKQIAQISFLLSAELNWKLYLRDAGQGPYIEFREVQLAVARTGAADPSGYVAALLRICDVDVFLLAERQGAGWQFSGSTGPDQEIPIGDLLADLSRIFSESFALPSAITGLVIENLAVTFDTRQKDFTFACDGRLPIEEGRVAAHIAISVTHDTAVPGGQSAGYTLRFGGHVSVPLDGGDALQFDLTFVRDSAAPGTTKPPSDILIGVAATDKTVKLQSLVHALSPTAGGYVPEGLEIGLKDVLFALYRSAPGTQFLLGLDLSAALSLSDLPLVGEKFPPDRTAGVNDLQLLIASQAFAPEIVTRINDLIAQSSPGGGTAQVTPLPAPVNAGLNATAILAFGGTTQPLALPIPGPQTPPATGGTPTPPAGAGGGVVAPTTSGAGAKWFDLQKTFGPVHFNRVGVRYKDGALWFLLDAALSAAGLTLSLDGLGLGSPLKEFKPEFALSGLGLDFRGGGVEIGGALVKVEKNGLTEYDGMAVIKAEQLTLKAIGSYALTEGQPSLFVYGVLDYPLGGPSFFFVTGLAAGFGYNRALIVPPVEGVANFPFVRLARDESGTYGVDALLRDIGGCTSLQTGQYFLAAGIKYTSFKMIDSFALLTVSFGRRSEVDLLGLSTLLVPTPVPGVTTAVTPLAEIQMALKATFAPEEGFLGVSAQLTAASYLFSRNCRLTGGFAFYCWFRGDHAGDFVTTLGGYHPRFNLSEHPHYPRVPRLGFNWQVDSRLSIKGDGYAALTPSALMAGGHLEATWNADNLKVWFAIGADFLLAWQPYHYEADAYAELRIAYTFEFFGRHTLNLDAGAELHLQGPEFSGTARVHLNVISFTISFGHPAARPEALRWDQFHAAFLPPDSGQEGRICGVSVRSGLALPPGGAKTDGAGEWVVNPTEFALVTNSLIPAKDARIGGKKSVVNGVNPDFGVAPMQVGPDRLSSTHVVAITRPDERDAPAEADFHFGPVFKDAPAGMWGLRFQPGLNDAATIPKTLAGYEIRPAAPPRPGETRTLSRDRLLLDVRPVENAIAFLAPPPPARGSSAALQESLDDPATQASRNRLLEALGFRPDEAVDNLTGAVAAAFVTPPEIGEFPV